MAKQIWKYSLPNPLHDGCSTSIDLPKSAVALSVHEQHGELQMWVMLDPEQPRITRHFEVLGTGMTFDDTQRLFIGTVILRAFVWHAFEIYKPTSNGGNDERS